MSQEKRNSFNEQNNGAEIPGSSETAGSAAAGAVSDELVRKVADKVFRMLLAELRQDFERQRLSGSEFGSRISANSRGGW
jgi:hypothetical protein